MPLFFCTLIISKTKVRDTFIVLGIICDTFDILVSWFSGIDNIENFYFDLILVKNSHKDFISVGFITCKNIRLFINNIYSNDNHLYIKCYYFCQQNKDHIYILSFKSYCISYYG